MFLKNLLYKRPKPSRLGLLLLELIQTMLIISEHTERHCYLFLGELE